MVDADKHPLGIFESGENYDKADLKLWIKNFAPYVSWYTTVTVKNNANSWSSTDTSR